MSHHFVTENLGKGKMVNLSHVHGMATHSHSQMRNSLYKDETEGNSTQVAFIHNWL